MSTVVKRLSVALPALLVSLLVLSAFAARPAVAATGVHAAPAATAPAATPTVVVAPTLTVTPPTSTRGGLVAVSGAGFAANEGVAISIDGVTTPITTITALASGALPSTSVMIPYTAAAGARTLTATGATSHRTATARVVRCHWVVLRSTRKRRSEDAIVGG